MKPSPWAIACGIVAGAGVFLAISILGLIIALPSGWYLLVNQYREYQSIDHLEGLGEGLGVRLDEKKMNSSAPSADLGSGPPEDSSSSLVYWGYGLIAFCSVNVLASGFFGKKVYKKIQENELSKAMKLLSKEHQPAEGNEAQIPPVISGITTCDWCLEEVKIGARVCKHCGRDPNEDSS